MKYLSAVAVAIMLAVVVSVGASTVTSDPAEAATYQARKCGGGTISLNGKEFKSFKQHNNIRRQNGLSTLCVHPALQRAARKHSRDMINRDYFSHNTKGSGATAGQRISRENYKWRTYGENIAWGSGSKGSPEAIMNSWMNSSGHRTNILNGSFKEIGIGVVNGNYSGYDGASMYTADFGAR